MASCWCLHQYADYEDAVLAAVNLGGDTDTTAAVVGGLAGLRCGLSGIPHAWIACLPRRVEVLAQAERFADTCLQHWRRS
jgi:ADP-ribosylglycohydrolase